MPVAIDHMIICTIILYAIQCQIVSLKLLYCNFVIFHVPLACDMHDQWYASYNMHVHLHYIVLFVFVLCSLVDEIIAFSHNIGEWLFGALQDLPAALGIRKMQSK